MALLKKGSRGGDVVRLQQHLTLVGELDDSIDGIFGPATEAAVRGFQRRHQLDVDGIAGPRTLGRLAELIADGALPLEILRHAERERNAAQIDVEAPADAPAEPAAGTAPALGARADEVLARARAEWESHVQEPRGQGWERIDDYIRGAEGLGWRWLDRYERDGQFAWCGAFASFCYTALEPGIRDKDLASTYRIARWARGTPRIIPFDDVQPGDIVIVGPARGSRWGAHITVCERVDGDAHRVLTIEGNARGTGPDGSRYSGVIRQARPFPSDDLSVRTYRVMDVVRPLPDDFA